MDLSEVGIRHVVRFEELRVRHTVDVSPVAASIARDVRYCVIAIILGISTVAIAKSYLATRHNNLHS